MENNADNGVGVGPSVGPMAHLYRDAPTEVAGLVNR